MQAADRGQKFRPQTTYFLKYILLFPLSSANTINKVIHINLQWNSALQLLYVQLARNDGNGNMV